MLKNIFVFEFLKMMQNSLEYPFKSLLGYYHDVGDISENQNLSLIKHKLNLLFLS